MPETDELARQILEDIIIPLWGWAYFGGTFVMQTGVLIQIGISLAR